MVIGAGDETRGPPGERVDARFEGLEGGVRERERGRDALGERGDDGGHVARARVRTMGAFRGGGTDDALALELEKPNDEFQSSIAAT